MTLIFYVNGLPKPAGSKRGFAIKRGGMFTGRVAIVDDCKGSRDWKSDVSATAGMFAKQACWMPTRKAVRLTLVFFMPRPKAHYGSGKNSDKLKPDAPLLHTKKPDALKLARAVEDALTGIAYADDSQIADERLHKRYTHLGSPGVSITITELNDDGSE